MFVKGFENASTEELKNFLEYVYIDENYDLTKYKEKEDYIELFYQRFKHRVRFKDIRYIEAYNGYTEFLVGTKRFRREESLKDIERMIDMSMFVKIRRSVVVNLMHIKRYENMEVEVGGKIIPISRRRRKSFEEIYTRYQILTTE